MAPIKRERIRFNNYSTSTCGLRRKNLTEQTLLKKDSVTKQDEGGVLEDSRGAGSGDMEAEERRIVKSLFLPERVIFGSRLTIQCSK